MGVHDSYCVICGITTTKIPWYKNDIDELKDILKSGEFRIPSKGKYPGRLGKKTKKIDSKLSENYKKYISDVKKLKSKFKWLDQIYLITDNKVIKNTNNLEVGDYGNFDKYETHKFIWEDGVRALVCHKSCYELLNKKLKYKLEINDVINKLDDHSLLSNYGKYVTIFTGHQEFPWTAMILNIPNFINFENIMILNKKLEIDKNTRNFLFDPLKNKKNADRIINIWKPIIKNLKLKPKTSKKKLKTNRPSPSESATLFKTGQKKKGNDGNLYIVVENKNKVKRWKKIV